VTTPNIDLESIVPSKAKAWVGLFGSLVTFVGPYVLSSTDALPAPWPVVIGIVFAVLTTLGIYKAPYKPTGTVLAPVEAVTPPSELPAATPDNPRPISDKVIGPNIGRDYQNPWKK